MKKNGVELKIILIICHFFEFLFLINAENDFNQIFREIKKSVIIERGKRSLNSEQDIINTFIDVSLDDCIWKCYSKYTCEAADYVTTTKYCVLYRKLDEMETKGGRMVIHDFVEKGSRMCGTTACNSRETCRFSGGSFSCFIEECSNPNAGSAIDGNLFKIGSKYTTRCAGTNTTLQCAENGQWWTMEGMQSGLTCQDMGFTAFQIFTNRLGITLACTDNGDWMVIQRRRFGYLDFYRDWEDYKYGFGSICSEFWLGLEHIYNILENSGETFELHFELTNWAGDSVFANYDFFNLEDEDSLYSLTVFFYNSQSTAGDSLSGHSGQAFSTYDRDNDRSGGNCAAYFYGAWWFNQCYASHLNGKYYKDGINERDKGIIWLTYTGRDSSLKTTSMRMRVNPDI